MALGKMTVGAQGNVTPPFDKVVRSAQRCEQQGYDIIWWFDHLMSMWPQSIWTTELAPPAKAQSSPHIHFDPLATISAVGTVTERAMLGTAVTDALRRPPAVLAQEVLTLDHITKGRVILGIGAGEACNCAPYGIDCSKPVSRLEEAVKIIRLLWESKEPVDYDGQFWKLHGAVMSLQPYRSGRFPPIWIGGAGPRTLQLVGQQADGWLPWAMPLADYAEKIQIVRQAAREAGRDPDAITCGLWEFCVIDEDHEECHRIMNKPLLKAPCLLMPPRLFEDQGCRHPLGASGLTDFIPSLLSRRQALELIDAVPFEVAHSYYCHGSPRELAEFFTPYVAAGCRHVGFQNFTFAGDADKLSSSFRLLAETANLLRNLA